MAFSNESSRAWRGLRISSLLIAGAVFLPAISSADVFDIVYTDTATGGMDVYASIQLTADYQSPGVYLINPSEPYSGSGFNQEGSYSSITLLPPGNPTPGSGGGVASDNLLYYPLAGASYLSNSACCSGFAFIASDGFVENPYNADSGDGSAAGEALDYEYTPATGNTPGVPITLTITDLSTPEPSSLLLMLGGVAALAFVKMYGRRRTA